MELYTGKSIYQSIAIGPICVYSKRQRQVKRMAIQDFAAEWERYQKAKRTAALQLSELYKKALKEVGEVNAAIFEVQSMMLDDDDYNNSVKNIMESQKVNAEYAVAVTADNFSVMFSEMEDDYFRARSADVKDISERLLCALAGNTDDDISVLEHPSILAASDLAPSETVQMDKQNLLGLVTELGSANSHTAILARTMGLPALTGISIREEWDGKQAVLDGWNGILYVDPDEETLRSMRKRQEEDQENARLLEKLKGKATATKNGKTIRLYANIGNLSDLACAAENDAEGIGLFRSEFLYLEKTAFPTEEEQFLVYQRVAQTMAGKKVIIRTLDLGADKQAAYFQLPKEENPAMGYRAIRICLKQPDIFKTQLRALFRAAVYGNVSVMYPMITSADEILKIKKIVNEVQNELTAEGLPFSVPEQGIMIETPAAALISDELAQLVDFFSIGTNDLTQYTLAVDRQNEHLEDFYNPHHKAILKMIQMTIENAHKYGKWAGICGELGADLSLTETFVQMGIDELSVAPSMILKVRQAVCSVSG